jgi:hypothetical protein
MTHLPSECFFQPNVRLNAEQRRRRDLIEKKHLESKAADGKSSAAGTSAGGGGSKKGRKGSGSTSLPTVSPVPSGPKGGPKGVVPHTASSLRAAAAAAKADSAAAAAKGGKDKQNDKGKKPAKGKDALSPPESVEDSHFHATLSAYVSAHPERFANLLSPKPVSTPLRPTNPGTPSSLLAKATITSSPLTSPRKRVRVTSPSELAEQSEPPPPTDVLPATEDLVMYSPESEKGEEEEEEEEEGEELDLEALTKAQWEQILSHVFLLEIPAEKSASETALRHLCRLWHTSEKGTRGQSLRAKLVSDIAELLIA